MNILISTLQRFWGFSVKFSRCWGENPNTNQYYLALCDIWSGARIPSLIGIALARVNHIALINARVVRSFGLPPAFALPARYNPHSREVK